MKRFEVELAQKSYKFADNCVTVGGGEFLMLANKLF